MRQHRGYTYQEHAAQEKGDTKHNKLVFDLWI